MTDTVSHNRAGVWSLRLLLAGLFLFTSEILLWLNPQDRTVTDWLVLIPGYIVLGVVVLDLASRYRIRDLYDTMALAAIYGLANAFLLNPDSALVDFPRTIATRALGGHGVMGLFAFGLFVTLTGGGRYRLHLFGMAVNVGFAWSVWVRWSPELSERISQPISLETMFLYAGVIVAGLCVLFAVAIATRKGTAPPDLRLSPLGMAILGVVVMVIFILRAVQGLLDAESLLPMIALIVLAWAMLWFRHDARGNAMLDAHIPLRPLSPVWVGVALMIFSATAILVYNLPLVTILGINQLLVVDYVLAAAGFAWLPFLAAVIGLQAFERQYRRLDV